MKDVIEKYSDSTIRNLNKDNMLKIVDFLISENCDFIEDILEDYLDLFAIDYETFINKYNRLNKKYNYNLLNNASKDMNVLEDFFKD